ncbi:regulator of chromosome condensation-like isoform X2 [Arctopsyche grandis]
MHTVAIDKNGDVWTFGCNDEGALGRDITNTATNEWVPSKVALPGKAVRVSAGDSHTAALLESGQVYAWGSFRDSHGNMGLTAKGNERSPVEMLPGHRVVQIASGGDHLVMLTEMGQIFTCGCAEQGQLGRVTARSCDRNSRLGLNPLLIPAPLNFRPKDKVDFDMLWAGTYCTFAREATKGSIYVWGLNNYQQIGVRKGSPGTVFAPVVSEAFSALKDAGWTKITGGPHHTLALDAEGTCYVIGRREYGRLGLGENCEDAVDLTPVPILNGKKCVQIACGTAASFAITDTGDIYAWGMGTSGQLGTGADDDEIEPKLLRSKQIEGRFALNVSAGGQHTVVLVESPPEANDHIAEPAKASTAPQTKVNAVEAKKKDEAAGASSETADVEMKDDKEVAKKNKTENMDVDEAADEKKDEKPARKAPAKRGRKGSASSTASTESSRSTKAAKNKQNGGLSTVKESASAEVVETVSEESTETQTGGTQSDDAEKPSNQKLKREESESDEPEAKRSKMDSEDSTEKQSDAAKKEVAPEESESDMIVESSKKDENLSNGNGDAESSSEAKEEAAPDVEMKSVSDVVEKKCISSESEDAKTEGDVARTEVKTS